jgi:hypothetical protein
MKLVKKKYFTFPLIELILEMKVLLKKIIRMKLLIFQNLNDESNNSDNLNYKADNFMSSTCMCYTNFCTRLWKAVLDKRLMSRYHDV